MSVGESINKGMAFLREARVELSKVTWPTRKETIASTVVVVVTVFVTTVFLGVVDFFLVKVMKAIYG